MRRNEAEQSISVALYGEVQREVIKGLLLDRYGIEVVFEETTTVYVEKVVGVGRGLEVIWQNAFAATVGLCIEPGAPGTGVTYRLEVEPGGLPAAFHKAIEETVRQTLQQRLYGWEVIDCVVTLTDTAYFSPVTAAGDFRRLTPLVLMAALCEARTAVHEPVNRFELEVPADAVRAVMSRLLAARAIVDRSEARVSASQPHGTIPASSVYAFERQLPGQTRGEGVFVSELSGYRETGGTPPARRRTDGNPLNRKEYLTNVLKRLTRSSNGVESRCHPGRNELSLRKHAAFPMGGTSIRPHRRLLKTSHEVPRTRSAREFDAGEVEQTQRDTGALEQPPRGTLASSRPPAS